MAFCRNCGSPIDNDSIFCRNCGQRVGVVIRIQQHIPNVPHYQLEEQKPFKPNSCMGLAFFTTLCCSPIFGIYAMILADKVDSLYYSGRYEEAEMKAADSKKWSIIGIVFGVVFNFILIIVLIYLEIITDGEIFNII